MIDILIYTILQFPSLLGIWIFYKMKKEYGVIDWKKRSTNLILNPGFYVMQKGTSINKDVVEVSSDTKYIN